MSDSGYPDSRQRQKPLYRSHALARTGRVAVAGDIAEEQPAARQLVVELVDPVNDTSWQWGERSLPWEMRMFISKRVFSVFVMAVLAVSLAGCGWDSDPTQCGAIPEAKGQSVAKKSLLRFLQYAGKTHAPLTGDGGTLDAAKLERVSDHDLIYDGRSLVESYTYQFHLRWAPNASFTGTVAPNCSVETNWSIK